MSKTYRHTHKSSLLSNGERGHHNTLTREFKGIDGCWTVKDCRNLIDRADYESSRMKGIRKIMTQKRRTVIKRNIEKIIDESICEALTNPNSNFRQEYFSI